MNIAWKEIRYNKKNYLLIVLTILLLIFMVIFLSGMANGLKNAAVSSLNQLPKGNFVLNKDAEGSLVSSNLSDDIISNLKEKDSNGESIIVNRSFISTNDDKSKIDIVYFAVDKKSELLPNIIEGARFEPNTIILSEKYKNKGIKLNDFIEDRNSNINLKVVGFVNDTKYNYTDVGFITFDTFSEIKKEVTGNSNLMYNAFLTNNDSISIDDDLQLLSRQELIDKMPGFNAQQNTIFAITWLLIAISSSILGVFFYIITIQKQQQLGVLKALGMSNFEISKSLISQIVMLSVLGLVIANVLAYILSLFLPDNVPYMLQYQDVIIVSVAFIVISIISGLMSILKISKVDPLDVIGGVK